MVSLVFLLLLFCALAFPCYSLAIHLPFLRARNGSPNRSPDGLAPRLWAIQQALEDQRLINRRLINRGLANHGLANQRLGKA